MHSDVPSIRSRRNIELENELKEYDEAQKQSLELSDDIGDNSSGQQKGGDPVSPATTGWEKRYADLRSYSQKKENELKKELDVLRSQVHDLTREEIKFPKTESELEAWVEKYPDVAAMVETIALKKVQSVREEIETTKLSWAEEKLKKERKDAFEKLLGRHPDFVELRETEEFQTWAEEQAKWVREALYENDTDADSVIDAVDLYKARTGKAAQKSTPKTDDRKEAARATARTQAAEPEITRDANKIYESDIKKMSQRDYKKHADKIDQAYAEGRIVYDLSGAAR